MELVSGQFNHENGIKKHIRASLEKIESSYISSFSFIYNLCVPLSTNLFIFLEKKKKRERHKFIEQTFGPCGRRRGWDVSREQHRNMYTIKGETDYRPRLDA